MDRDEPTTVIALLAYTALGIFLISIGGSGLLTEGESAVQTVFDVVQVVAGISFLVSVGFGVHKRVKARRNPAE